MSSRLVLVGAGSHGRGTLEILRARTRAGLPAPEVIGFVDDAARAGDVDGVPVLGPVEHLVERAPMDGLSALLALADPEAKRRLAERLGAVVAGWATAVHPTAVFSGGVSVAPGAIVGAGVIVAHDTSIESHTTVNLGATVGHDCRVGRFSTIAPGVNVAGSVTIGEGVQVQTNATIVPGLSLGDGVRVGPGAVLLRDASAGGVYVGNPARRVPDPAAPSAPDDR